MNDLLLSTSNADNMAVSSSVQNTVTKKNTVCCDIAFLIKVFSSVHCRHVPQGAFGWGLEFHWATQPGNKGMAIQKNSRDDHFT